MKTKIEFEFYLDPKGKNNSVAELYSAVGKIRKVMSHEDFDRFREELGKVGIRLTSIRTRRIFGWLPFNN